MLKLFCINKTAAGIICISHRREYKECMNEIYASGKTHNINFKIFNFHFPDFAFSLAMWLSPKITPMPIFIKVEIK